VRCFVVAGFLLTSASCSPSAIAELLVLLLLTPGKHSLLLNPGTFPKTQFLLPLEKFLARPLLNDGE